MVAAAIGVAAVAGLAGSAMSSSAAKSAAKTQANAANNAAGVDMAKYEQTRNDLLPYQQSGSAYNNML
jgi:uncharacterized protein (UPF0333 family)